MKISKDKITVSILRLLGVTGSCFIYSMGVGLLLNGNHIVPGGASGVSVMLSYLFNIPTGTLLMIINIPLLIIAFIRFKFKFGFMTLYAVICCSIFINYLVKIGPLTTEPILAAFVGGALDAIGLALAFRCGASTGGMDIIVKLLRQVFPQFKSGKIFLALDMIIVISSGFVFGAVDNALYATITLFVSTTLMDIVLYGMDEAKMTLIVTNKAQDVGARLLNDLNTGVTFLESKGAYSNTEGQMILCVVKKHDYHKLQSIVRSEDSKAFMIVCKATETFGEGYANFFSDKV